MEGGTYRWTPEERRTLLDLRSQGLSFQQIADQMPGRTKKAIGNYVCREGIQAGHRYRLSRPALPPEPPREIADSEALRDATLAAFARFANDNALSEQEARAILLGREKVGNVTRIHPAATDRTGYRPCEIIARPIGEIIKPIVARVLEGQG